MTLPFSIRSMVPEDIDAVVANENAAYEFPWTRGLFEGNLKRHYCRVIENKDGSVVGHALLSIVLDEATILNIAIAPHAQRNGLGRYLMNDLLSYATKQECREVYLEVRQSNESALCLYRSLGFNEIGLRANYYPGKNGREDAVLLACVL